MANMYPIVHIKCLPRNRGLIGEDVIYDSERLRDAQGGFMMYGILMKIKTIQLSINELCCRVFVRCNRHDRH